jgi:hypothetical protein
VVLPSYAIAIPSLVLSGACAHPRGERGNATRNRFYVVGYVTANPEGRDSEFHSRTSIRSRDAEAFRDGLQRLNREDLTTRGLPLNHLEGATMPNGQEYEDRLKSKGRELDG